MLKVRNLLTLLTLLTICNTASAVITKAQVEAKRDYHQDLYNSWSNQVVTWTDICAQYHILSPEFAQAYQSAEQAHREKEKHLEVYLSCVGALLYNESDYTQRIAAEKSQQEQLAAAYSNQDTTRWVYDEENSPAAIMYPKSEKHSYAVQILGGM